MHACAQDQEHLERLSNRDLRPLVHLGDGGQGNVQLCSLPLRKLREATSIASNLGGTDSCAPSPVRGSFNRDSAAQQQLEKSRSASSLRRTLEQGGDRLSHSGEGDATCTAARRRGQPGHRSMRVQPPERSSRTSSSGTASDARAPISGGAASSQLPGPSMSSGRPAAVGLAGGGAEDGEAAADAEAEEASGSGVEEAEAEVELVVAVKSVRTGWNQERELLQLHRWARAELDPS